MSNLAEAMVEIGADTSNLKSGLSSASGMVKGFGAGLKSALGPVGLAIAGVVGGVVALKSAIGNFMEGEESTQKLASAMKGIGADVDSNVAKFDELAATIQQYTGQSDEATKNAAAMAANMGLTDTDQIAEAVKTATALSELYGGSVEDNIKKVTDAMNGNGKALGGLSSKYKGVTDQQQILAMLQEDTAKGMESGGDRAQTMSGAWGILKENLGNLSETIGGMFGGGGVGAMMITWLSDTVKWLTDGAAVVVGWKDAFLESFSAASGVAGTWQNTLVGAWEFVKDAFDAGISTIMFNFENFGLYLDMMKESFFNTFKLAWETIKTFGNNVGIVAKYIWDNLGGILTDIGNLSATIFTNVAETAKSVFSNLWKAISTGDIGALGEIEFKNPLEGFKSSLENELKLDGIDLGVMDTEATDEYAKKLKAFHEKRMADKEKEAADEKKKQEELAKSQLKLNEQITDAEPKPEDKPKTPETPKERTLKDVAEKTAKNAGGQISNAAGLANSILSATLGRDKAAEQLKETQRQTELLEKIEKNGHGGNVAVAA